MKYVLSPLRLGSLSHSEVAELATRTLTDYGSIPPPDPRTDDSILKTYLQGIAQRSVVFDKAINRIQKDVNTKAIADSDLERDRAVTSLFKAIRVAITSDIAAEINAAQRLMMVVDAYMGVTRQNYEAETKMIDTMVADLEGGTYSTSVTALNLQRYVTRIKNTNNAFKEHFTNRMTTTALTESFDTNSLRIDLLDYYKEYITYLTAMANATNNSFFVQQFNLVNTARKYYSDVLARRITQQNPNPVTATQSN